ncbi:trypsin-like serine protease [Actinoplanes philippinensis]|uniref:trypsin-like serine protease n=1 Tax=Actinoplanes philippinensis TaxID=35752 RepID=UPI0033CACE32
MGDKVLAAGFGRTGGEWIPDRAHAGEFSVTAVADGLLDVAATADGAICRGDAGGPVLRPVTNGYQLLGVHSRSWLGGCLGETGTRREAVEARLDDIGPWIAANSGYPNALQLSTTDTRVGVVKGDYGTQVKEGALNTAWTALTANAKDIIVVDDRIGVLTHDGVAYVKDGATTAAFVTVHTGVKQLALSADRVGVVTTAGVAYVKEGALHTAWVNQGSNVASLAVTDTRVGIVSDDVFGDYKVKEGGLNAAWTGPTGTGRPMVSRIVLSGSRVGLLYRSGAATVYEGNLKWGADAANKTKSYTLVSSGAADLTINDDRVGVLTTAGVALVKEGAMTTAFVTEYTGARDLAVSGSRVGVVTLDGAALVKHGGLSAAWSTIW